MSPAASPLRCLAALLFACALASALACGGHSADCAGAAGSWITAYTPVTGDCTGKASGPPLNVTLDYTPLPDGGADLHQGAGVQVVSSSSTDVPGGCDVSLVGREGGGQTGLSVSFRGDSVTGCASSGDYTPDGGVSNSTLYRIFGRRQ